jgi:hypothetical protein
MREMQRAAAGGRVNVLTGDTGKTNQFMVNNIRHVCSKNDLYAVFAI